MAECGVASRRKCEELIRKGHIKVNGQIVKDMGVKIDPEKDVVSYDGKTVEMVEEKVYIMLHKPTGYVTTSKEQFDRRKVTDLLKDVKVRVYPVGRLDYNTSGLLLLTNDGDLAFKLTHPGHEVNKTYIATVKGVPNENSLEKLRNGKIIDGYMTSKAEVNLLRTSGSTSVIEVIIHEGRNRQVRKMFSAIGHEVLSLKRIAVGDLHIGDLKVGRFRYLTDGEISYLKSL